MTARSLSAAWIAIALAIWPTLALAAEPKPGDSPIIVVTASYPGANCQVVADTVAAPIEQQIKGAKGLLRIESESRNDGSYAARLRYDSMADAKLAIEEIQNRVTLAEPTLPELVRRRKIAVTIGKVEKSDGQVTIAVIDRGEHGVDATQKLADAVMKRLTAETALTKPVMFPLDETQQLLRVDRERCARFGVSAADVYKAINAAKPGTKIDDLKQLKVKSKTGEGIPLGSLAAFELVRGPAAIFRVNLYPAIRIRGGAAKGKAAAESAARCVELAEAELKRGNATGFAVENLTLK